VPLATSHRAHEFEHVLKDADPEIIIIGGHVSRGEEEGVATTRTLPPHNEGELLQAANAVGVCLDSCFREFYELPEILV
jgi:hypothetical protein